MAHHRWRIVLLKQNQRFPTCYKIKPLLYNVDDLRVWLNSYWNCVYNCVNGWSWDPVPRAANSVTASAPDEHDSKWPYILYPIYIDYYQRAGCARIGPTSNLDISKWTDIWVDITECENPKPINLGEIGKHLKERRKEVYFRLQHRVAWTMRRRRNRKLSGSAQPMFPLLAVPGRRAPGEVRGYYLYKQVWPGRGSNPLPTDRESGHSRLYLAGRQRSPCSTAIFTLSTLGVSTSPSSLISHNVTEKSLQY